MLIGPFFFFISTSASVFFVHKVQVGLTHLDLGPLLFRLPSFHRETGALLPILVPFRVCLSLHANKKVPFSSAMLGGVIGGTLSLIVQWGYIYFFRSGLTGCGAIYGSFAAFPLFLVFGFKSVGSSSFWEPRSRLCHPNARHARIRREVETGQPSYKRLLSLWIVHLAISKFVKGEPPLTREAVIVRYQVPYSLAVPLLEDLVAAGVLLETPSGFLPAKGSKHTRISDVCFALDEKGCAEFPYIDATALAPFERALESFRAQIEASTENKPLYPM